jgi:hypothetical protein
VVSLDPERRAAFVAAKLRALVNGRWGEAEREPVAFGSGAALVEGDRLYVLAEDQPARTLGAALALADRHGSRSVELIAAAAEGVLARRAPLFSDSPRVWGIRGDQLVEAAPEPFPVAAPVPDEALAYEDVFLAAGAEPVREHGVLLAEVKGLEVARAHVDSEGVLLEVGVGKHDREAQRLVRGELPPVEAFAAAVQAVRARRQADALSHEVNHLALSRWLRSEVMALPHIVGAARLWPVPPVEPAADLRAPVPAVAAGESVAGEPLLVVCSAGIDVDLVATGADHRAADPRRPRLRFVLPARDDHPLTRRLVARLVEPADVVLAPDTWKRALA